MKSMILASPAVIVKYANAESVAGRFFMNMYDDAQHRVIENNIMLDSVRVTTFVPHRIHNRNPSIYLPLPLIQPIGFWSSGRYSKYGSSTAKANKR